MARRTGALRPIALLSAGALALHELRYRAGYGSEAAGGAAADGHGYLGYAAVVGAVLVAAALFGFGIALLRARRGCGGPAARVAPLPRMWLAASGALLAIHVVQEIAESLVVAGDLADVAALAGAGGVVAVVLATALGALVALLLRGADQALTLAARPGRARRGPAPLAVGLPRAAARLDLPRASLLSLNLAGRAPPAAC